MGLTWSTVTEGMTDPGRPEGNIKDPVCEMNVAPGAGYAEMYQGHPYLFCSKKCLDKFEAEPQRYVVSKVAM